MYSDRNIIMHQETTMEERVKSRIHVTMAAYMLSSRLVRVLANEK